MTNTIKTSQQSGRSMVEMLGVLAIVGVLSIGGIAGYSKAMAKYKINKTLDQVSMIIAGIRTAYGNQNSYTGLSNTTAINAEIVGSDLTLGSGSKLTNAYAGDITLHAGTVKTSDKSFTACADNASANNTYCPAFSIEVTNIDKTACATIASSDWGGTAGSGLFSIAIKSGTSEASTHTWSDNGGDTGLPIDYMTALKQCGGTGTNAGAYSTATITWVYY